MLIFKGVLVGQDSYSFQMDLHRRSIPWPPYVSV